MDIHFGYNLGHEIHDLLKNHFEELTSRDYSIPITFSDEIPPGKEFGKYPIDRLMGLYIPETRNIVIYLQGISQVARELADKIANTNLYEKLMTLTILHEIGHYWFHNVSNAQICDRCFKNDPFAPVFINDYIDEWVAQMFAYVCIEQDSNLQDIMIKLSKNQDEKYQSFLIPSGNDFKHITHIFQNAIVVNIDEKIIASVYRNYILSAAIEDAKTKLSTCKFNL